MNVSIDVLYPKGVELAIMGGPCNNPLLYFIPLLKSFNTDVGAYKREVINQKAMIWRWMEDGDLATAMNLSI